MRRPPCCAAPSPRSRTPRPCRSSPRGRPRRATTSAGWPAPRSASARRRPRVVTSTRPPSARSSLAEVAALVEAEQAYAAAGDPSRAQSASAGAAVLQRCRSVASRTRPRHRRTLASSTGSVHKLCTDAQAVWRSDLHPVDDTPTRLWTHEILRGFPCGALPRGIEISHALLSGRAGRLGNEGPHSGATHCGSRVTRRPGPEQKSSRSGASHRPITPEGPLRLILPRALRLCIPVPNRCPAATQRLAISGPARPASTA